MPSRERRVCRLRDDRPRLEEKWASVEVQQILGDAELESITNTPADFAVMIRGDAKIWDAAAASAG